MNTLQNNPDTIYALGMLEEQYGYDVDIFCKIVAALNLDDDAKEWLEEYARFIASNKNNPQTRELVAIAREQCDMIIEQAENKFDALNKNPR